MMSKSNSITDPEKVTDVLFQPKCDVLEKSDLRFKVPSFELWALRIRKA